MKKIKLNSINFWCTSLLSCLMVLQIPAQDSEDRILETYQTYFSAPREIAFIHLNKSTLITGEMLGLTAYVLEQSSKKRSLLTTNLYCTISDKNGIVIKEKLLLVENGISSNVFNIDNSFASGYYTIKAYTSWMKNFNEQTHFQQTIRIINEEKGTEIASDIAGNAIDVQLLGEGGHLLYDVFNTAGVIAKNDKGQGLSMANVKILDANDAVISQTTLNQFGIGKTFFLPERGKSYFIEVTHNGKAIKKPIDTIDSKGLVFSINETQDNLGISIKTNTASISQLKNKDFKLAIHNGSDIKLLPIKILNEREDLLIPLKDLEKGINILTLLDHNNSPILERLFFNSKDITIPDISISKIRKAPDSLTITLNIKNINPEAFHNLSISTLPNGTKSYNNQHNILSHTYLQPYIKTPIENARYYFKNTSNEIKYDLDLLLLTQGWSSYNWQGIFNSTPILKHSFEQGIEVVANLNERLEGTYLVYPLRNSSTQVFQVSKDNERFIHRKALPVDSDKLKVGYINTFNTPSAPKLYPQFFPSKIPDFDKEYNDIYIQNTVLNNVEEFPVLQSSWGKTEELKEVVVTAEKERTYRDDLKVSSNGTKLFKIGDSDKQTGKPLSAYLQSIGINARYDNQNKLFTINGQTTSSALMVYLDDIPLQSFEILSTFNMDLVDKVSWNKYGATGLRGWLGILKIYTSPGYYYRNQGKIKVTTEFDFPLTFSRAKRYYTPEYNNFDTNFFREYGVIGWSPNVIIDKKGKLTFTVVNTGTEHIELYIEGIINDDILVSKKVDVSF
ncbi:hypothetical protein [uncultured Psychroserpens sp.]|uniref:hypothetical protein n=1 Tax=uncultured Psychroserpens sp. TaxID=255436 RepID=UPI0026303BE7|nr:hypothetical protein [uncultured Psychroserpens sp.]